jgi:16S rRNA (guanine527-N7)-methyltransferase
MNTPPTLSTIVADAQATLPEPLRTPEFESRLQSYLEALLDTNRGINLVSRQDTFTHVARFTRECAFLAALLDAEPKRPADKPPRLLDIGSGGGFPGMILKLALPTVQATLVEATQKKARFLAEVCRLLDLRGITILWARAEALADRDSSFFKPELRHHFDWVTAKALGSIEDSVRLAAPFLCVGGIHCVFKGTRQRHELRGARRTLRQLRLEHVRSEPVPASKDSYIVVMKQLQRS